jgi:hypothetical protein
VTNTANTLRNERKVIMMSWGFAKGAGTYGAPMSGKHTRIFGNGGKGSRNDRSRGKSQGGRGGKRGGKDVKSPGRGGRATDRWWL